MASNTASKQHPSTERAGLAETDELDGVTVELGLREASSAADRALREGRTLSAEAIRTRMRTFIAQTEAREAQRRRG